MLKIKVVSKSTINITIMHNDDWQNNEIRLGLYDEKSTRRAKIEFVCAVYRSACVQYND